MRADHAPDVLRVAQVERGVHLVEDVDGRRLEEQKREDERERQQRALAAGELGEGLLPHTPERDPHLQTGEEGLSLGRFELGGGTGE